MQERLLAAAPVLILTYDSVGLPDEQAELRVAAADG